MAISLTTPVTGGAQTGLTSPTYTITTDQAPESWQKQWAVTALGGTQTGVTVHSVSAPFTVTFSKPKTFKALGKANPTTGVVSSVPMNRYGCLVRKGVLPLAGQPYATCMLRAQWDIPAGSDTADAANLRAAFSLFIGSMNQQSAGIGDTVVSGVF